MLRLHERSCMRMYASQYKTFLYYGLCMLCMCVHLHACVYIQIPLPTHLPERGHMVAVLDWD